jgi:hypothetical protein
MSTTFRHRPAAEVVADLNFERFVVALELATTPVVPRDVIREHFSRSDGTVGEALDDLFDVYPQTVDMDVVLTDAQWVGGLDQTRCLAELETQLEMVRAEIDAVQSSLDQWDTFMDGHGPLQLGISSRVSRAAAWSADRSHGTRRRRSPQRRFEHP